MMTLASIAARRADIAKFKAARLGEQRYACELMALDSLESALNSLIKAANQLAAVEEPEFALEHARVLGYDGPAERVAVAEWLFHLLTTPSELRDALAAERSAT